MGSIEAGGSLPAKPASIEVTPPGKNKECLGEGMFAGYAMVYTQHEDGAVTIEITAPPGKDGSEYTYGSAEQKSAKALYEKISRVLTGVEPVEQAQPQGDPKQIEHQQ